MNAPSTLTHLAPQTPREVPAALIEALKARFGDQCSTALVVREQHGRDESPLSAPPPAAVVFAQSTQDVSDAVALAAQYAVPVIPFGVGSSLEGHLLAVQGCISIDVARMNQVVAVNPEDLTVTVQPGVTRKQLNEEIKSTGLFFPIDPGRRRVDRRHERHARQRHQRRALWNHARERAGLAGGDSQW